MYKILILLSLRWVYGFHCHKTDQENLGLDKVEECRSVVKSCQVLSFIDTKLEPIIIVRSCSYFGHQATFYEQEVYGKELCNSLEENFPTVTHCVVYVCFTNLCNFVNPIPKPMAEYNVPLDRPHKNSTYSSAITKSFCYYCLMYLFL